MPKKNNDPYAGILGIMSDVGGNAGKQAMHNDYTKTRIMTDTWHVGDKVMLIPIVGDDESTAEQYFVYGKCRRLDGNE